jgi:tRNA nucleotidyltransferase/poly(A) polymerase
MGDVVPKDVDIEVYGGSAKQVAAALRKLGPVDEVGRSFGVLKIRLSGEDFDVSLPRKDSKTGEGHRDFEVQVDPNLSLEEASARRDYTINALMYSHSQRAIIDNHGGLQDLRDGYLRHVSDAFDEDPLRVLRGVQMASRFGMRLHPQTIAKAQSLRDKYTSLATERVQIEFQKLYEKGKDPVRAMDALRATGWNRLFPGLAEADQTLLDERLRRAQALIDAEEVPAAKRPLILSATIASVLRAEDRQTFLKKTTVGDDLSRAARNLPLIEAPAATRQEVRKWVYGLPRNVSLQDWSLYQRALGNETGARAIETAAAEGGVLQGREQDLLRGNDPLQLRTGVKPGPWVRGALDAARNAQYEERFRTREEGLRWLSDYLKTLS